MDNIIQMIKDEFEDLKKISSILKQKSEFDAPYSFEMIEEWEKANSVKIPDMYKSWLLLTSYARIMDGRIELFFQKQAFLIKKMSISAALDMVVNICIFPKIQGHFMQSAMTKKNMKIFLISLHMFM